MKVVQLHEQTPKQLLNPTLTPKKVKNDPKIKSKLKVRIKEHIQNEICSATRVDPKTVFEPDPSPKNSPFGPQKVKMIQKSSQNQISEFKET